MKRTKSYYWPLWVVLAILLGFYGPAWAGDSKISALTELAVGGIADADMFLLVDADASLGKKYLWSSIKGDMKTYLDTLYQPLDSTLTDIADGTITENLVNTANPWAVNEGGTGAGTAAAARVNLLPAMSGKDLYLVRVASGAADIEYTNTLTVSVVNLPTSDADPSTTAGQIKHDSTDTDASAGGIIEWWDGTNTRRVLDGAASAAANYAIIVKTEFIPVAWMTDGAAAPGTLTTYETLKYRDFDDAATKDAQFIWIAPPYLIGTTVKVRAIAIVTNATAPANNEGVSWGISAACSAASASVDPARGTKVQSEDADLDDDCNAQYDVCYFPFVEVTPTALAASLLCAFTVERTHDDTDDDYTQDIGLIGVEIKYKARFNMIDTW
jgi:hypothetical protein